MGILWCKYSGTATLQYYHYLGRHNEVKFLHVYIDSITVNGTTAVKASWWVLECITQIYLLQAAGILIDGTIYQWKSHFCKIKNKTVYIFFFNIQLTLEQHGFEWCGSIYTWTFKLNLVFIEPPYLWASHLWLGFGACGGLIICIVFLCYFILGTWASVAFGIFAESLNQFPVDTEGWL